MSQTPKMVSEREAVLREREAYLTRARESYTERGWDQSKNRERAEASRRYPLERPRVVVADCGDWYRIVNGRIEVSRDGGKSWHFDFQRMPTPKRVALWADLLASPTEEVEEDASLSGSPT